VHCPRCGARAEPDDRYCAACGATLPGAEPEPQEKRSLRDRAADVIGTTPRARRITAVTVAVLAIAVIAFIGIDTSDDDEPIPQDSYTLAADDVCVQAKKEIGRESAPSLKKGFDAFAGSLVTSVAQWRSDFSGLQVPPGRGDEAAELDAALQEVEVKAGELARLAREGDRDAVVAEAEELDELTAEVETAISDLGLRKCSRIRIAPGVSGSPGG